MKKIILNICDVSNEKLTLEADKLGINVPMLILNRIFERPFSKEVEDEVAKKMQEQINEMCKE